MVPCLCSIRCSYEQKRYDMNSFPQIEPTSTASLLTDLSLAIDEIKLIRSIRNSTVIIKQLELEKPSSHKLLFQKREISNLEARLAKIRGKANRIKTDI